MSIYFQEKLFLFFVNMISISNPMKKILYLFFITLLFGSCEEDVVYNNPSVQGKLDNVFWRAIDSKAVLGTDGSLTLTAMARRQKMTLRVPSTNLGIYQLGNSNIRYASFLFTYETDELFYHTGNNMGGDGQIEITEFDAENGTVSGNFRFNALNIENNPLGGEILNFNRGVFYKVPITGVTD